MMRNILLDGDIVIYEVLLACETPWDWGDDVWTLHVDMKEARQRFDCWVSDLKEKLEAERLYIAYTHPDNWRKSVLPTYKSNRKKKRRHRRRTMRMQYMIRTERWYHIEIYGTVMTTRSTIAKEKDPTMRSYGRKKKIRGSWRKHTWR